MLGGFQSPARGLRSVCFKVFITQRASKVGVAIPLPVSGHDEAGLLSNVLYLIRSAILLPQPDTSRLEFRLH